MLSWQLHTGPEKAELQELNARLHDYVRRVRELERENLLLEEELRRRHGGLWGAEDQAARWAAEEAAAEEARGLRLQLDELSWATALAEGERDALRRELREVRLLAEEARAARRRLDAELGARRRELQEALGARAALEALLGRLQAERRDLDAARERDLRELRAALAASLTVSYSARALLPAAPPPPLLREVRDSCSLLVAESWRDTVQVYEEQVRALEAALRCGEESRRQAEEESRLCAREAEALQRQALELQQLRALLEEELMRMREAYELQAQERQSAIARLEDEKAALTLAMADRLRDHQELVQVKTSLSLEVATYRALLEGESNPEIQILAERLEHLPRELRTAAYGYTHAGYTNAAFRREMRENERNLFLTHKPPPPQNVHRRSWAWPAPPTPRRPFPGPGSPALTPAWRETAYEKTSSSSQASSRAFSPAYGGLRRKAEVPVTPRTEGGTKARPAREPSPAREPYRVLGDRRAAAGASESTGDEERIVVLGKKMTSEPERGRPGTAVHVRRDEKMFDSKEKASEERNLRWEELTKLDKEARERESELRRDKAKGKEPAARETGLRVREVPIRLEGSREGRAEEGSPKGARTPLPKDAGGGRGEGMDARRETRFGLDAGGSPGGQAATTETIAESIVSSVLKRFTQSPEAEAPKPPDTKVTYVGRTELPGERRAKTEIVVESRRTEEVDVREGAGLDALLSPGAPAGGLELKGKARERVIGDLLSLGLQGREGRAKVVNVEIVEEPVSYVAGARTEEFPTPFRVEEADDASPLGCRAEEEEEEEEEEEDLYGVTEVAFSADRREASRKSDRVSRVEEVTEAGDSEEEEEEQQSYFVSTPDEGPEERSGFGRDGATRAAGGSAYGQIHIEEESTIRYSWQDEIVPASGRRFAGPPWGGETTVAADAPESPPEPEAAGSPHWIEETTSGEVRAEATVTDKEIKIPHRFHSSISRDFKEPRHQLAEALGQLEESLPERVREELSALAGQDRAGLGHLSVDVRKVQPSGGGAMTLVAEVNLSQTVDTDQLDLEELSKDEAGEIERAVEAVVRDSLAKRRSPGPGSPDGDAGGPAPATGYGFKRWATQELYRASVGGEEEEEEDAGWASHSSETITAMQGPVSATVEVTSPRGFARSHVLEDVSSSVRRVKIGPSGVWRTEQVASEGPPAGQMDASPPAGAPRWARETTVLFATGTEGDAHSTTRREAGREPDGAAGVAASQEQAGFDRTVQLQRMVDQRSVISDEKKVAVVYLDRQADEDDGHWF
ncbi:synemin [Pipistrellus kuhlii]|uniref:Synemin n=1 Tax=Pipistrellus kuhlii TaxID=59472 RepID=A0A7J7SFM5_PIPKU|nr:synemin [Pipistrellus kuhlii]KAF6287189.1 synemin [Pipistrellus kuhlii]